MPGRYSVQHFHPANPAIQVMANVCASESDYGNERRADANETGLVAYSLTSVALDAIRVDYPGIVFRQLASLQDGLSPGTEDYRWDELDYRGMAKIIENYADDLPDVGAHMTSNTGKIRSLGNSFQYTKQDVRRVLEARRQGRQGVVLDVDRVVFAREVMERKKDQIAAYGDPLSKLPGIFKNPNVTLLSASAPGTGTDKKWTGTDKTGEEILADLRRLISQVRLQSKGIHTVNTLVLPVEVVEVLSMKPLLAGNQNQITVLQQFRQMTQEQGAINIVTWDRANTADALGTGPRILAYENNPRNLRLVEPVDFEAEAPQRVSLTFKVPCESRFGGIFWKRPLAGAYMDFI
jgi:hypothetical protein